jgi:hypothetical protein
MWAVSRLGKDPQFSLGNTFGENPSEPHRGLDVVGA